MANKKHYIINRITREEKYSGTYEECLEFYNIQDKSYRKLNRIIDDKEYQKIIKKKPNK